MLESPQMIVVRREAHSDRQPFAASNDIILEAAASFQSFRTI
jgi:hypothetical protein